MLVHVYFFKLRIDHQLDRFISFPHGYHGFVGPKRYPSHLPISPWPVAIPRNALCGSGCETAAARVRRSEPPRNKTRGNWGTELPRGHFQNNININMGSKIKTLTWDPTLTWIQKDNPTFTWDLKSHGSMRSP